ncbi:MAG TPA: hypothetical protein VGU67_06510 [Edaphobacter sp.]|nr:hypothetical protein [Edaphobacter sp.]
MSTLTNSNEAPKTKKLISKTAKVVIFETAMVLGCFVAMFTLPRSTPFRIFLTICGGILILGNFLLFNALRKPVNPARKINKTRMYFAGAILLIYWILVLVLK